MKAFFRVGIILCCLLSAASCVEKPVVAPEEEVYCPPDTLTVMEHLQESGTLRAVTNRQHHYQLQNGRPAGFLFELLDDFCELLDLNLNLLVNNSPDDCYRMLKEGAVDVFACEIDSLVTDSTYFYTIIDLPKEPSQTFAWVILDKENDTTLLSAISQWLDDYKKHDMRKSYYRYFKNGRIQYDSTLFDATHICQYDNLIRAEAAKIGMDWRLIASIIYQESHFKPDLVSSKGAFGLMQLMPVAMDKYGIDQNASVKEQLEVGGKLLLHLDREISEIIPDSLERINFVLASYNSGIGHVMDYREKALKNGCDPNVWEDNVERFSPQQTIIFVKEVTKRYSHYKALIE